jgi:hypothetical protein
MVSGDLKKMLGFNPVGMKCHKAFHDRDSPCPDCQNHEVIKKNGTPHIWVKYNEKLKKVFLVVDVMAYIETNPVKIELAIDITDKNDEIIKQYTKYYG